MGRAKGQGKRMKEGKEVCVRFSMAFCAFTAWGLGGEERRAEERDGMAKGREAERDVLGGGANEVVWDGDVRRGRFGLCRLLFFRWVFDM
jgi:hypothetical protein